MNQLRFQMNESLPLLKDRLLERMVTAKLLPAEREQKMEALHLRLRARFGIRPYSVTGMRKLLRSHLFMVIQIVSNRLHVPLSERI
ncbi:hypothetical protein RB620_22165 [Paenibacillus sp. LHD-117]|uniref:hypothetical protein n=1 Tax=Paenibacillus sp. LHD-117 TaxID=3071412 RepID=UPI0027E079ED|nr:hypothetical protein [Paenibacillus sp. LHD-117]MDQ6422140.1 hypothetical protein [Paenibacillus sp. LHD-117]